MNKNNQELDTAIFDIQMLSMKHLKDQMVLNDKIVTLRLNNQLKSATIESKIYDSIEEQINKSKVVK